MQDTKRSIAISESNITACKRLFFGCVLICCLFNSQLLSAQYSTSSYIRKYSPISVRLMEETGIPASVILGVAMLESGTGTSRNVKLLKNHFGIVGRNSLSKSKTKYRSRYKQYETDTASYRHFVKLLSKRKWFPDMKGNMEYAMWLKHMDHGGYSSAGHVWIKRVSDIIRRYKLYKMDKEDHLTSADKR